MFDLDVMVIGAGVVGLAIGRAFAVNGREVTIVDRHAQFGMETSSRNSEVIHAGIYYPKGSLKAALCVEGRTALYSYCIEHGIPHSRCGKLIVANGPDGVAGLEKIQQSAAAAGVDDLRPMERSAIQNLASDLATSAAVFSPSTGIIDSHALMQTYLGQITDNGGRFVGRTHVEQIGVLPGGGFRVRLAGEEHALTARTVINAAGLWADRVGRSIEGLSRNDVPTLKYARGVYFQLDGIKAPFRCLVYPLPDNASLGVHATLDLNGTVRFGPDVEWIDQPDAYHVDPDRARAFENAIADYWPAIRSAKLVPAYAGIRPKLSGKGDPPADFRIDGPNDHGIDQLCCLYGIESPGLTASIAIGERVRRLLSS